ncbi:uncharacterized protein LOC110814330 [Carica papaya]|uniref:uncharacterized protein LOC110814330 n=1 Tax=Carica papaya TaxID=3649 RepID=UPI000B8CE800|nr:uncharacterized protein LOC110814330 [Carica papaya]
MESGSTEQTPRSLMELSIRSKLSGPDQIIAIADVLAAKCCLPNNRPDYYSILQIPRTGSDIRSVAFAQFNKLITLLNPRASKFPLSKDAFNLVLDAWKVLSDPEKKTVYDAEISNGSKEPRGGKVAGSDESGTESVPRVENQYDENPLNGERSEEKQKHSVEKENATFWTFCPYCYCMFEYEKVYEDCSLRCQNCKRAFHGLEVPPLPQDVRVEGRDEYHCAVGFFPMLLPRDGFFIENKGKGGTRNDRMDNVGVISDDSDDGEERINVKKRKIFATGKKVEEEAVKREGKGSGTKLNGIEAANASKAQETQKERGKKAAVRREKGTRHMKTASVAGGQEGLDVEECRIESNIILISSEDELEVSEGDYDDIFDSLKAF